MVPTTLTDTLIIRRSSAPLETICARLPEVAQKHQFGVLGMHNLKAKMLSKGVAFDRECRVFEVCNPQQAKTVLSSAMEISTALPCRISVYEEGGDTVLASLRPTMLLSLFDAPGARAAAESVEAETIAIMDETAKG